MRLETCILEFQIRGLSEGSSSVLTLGLLDSTYSLIFSDTIHDQAIQFVIIYFQKFSESR